VPFWSLALVAVGVSADAFAVSLGKGLQLRALRVFDAARIALVFGAFQALMPLIGWALGSTFADSITAFDHWIAFALLGGIGAKMLWEAFKSDDDEEGPARLKTRELLLLGVATSIDALAVGVTFAFLEVHIGWAVTLIGVCTAALSFAAVYVGHRVGKRFSRPAEIAGGVILIAIGVKILIDHLGLFA
jgi:putative Mn2+ efflux pump MntP